MCVGKRSDRPYDISSTTKSVQTVLEWAAEQIEFQFEYFDC